jgi:excisionase family DNA binding protein
MPKDPEVMTSAEVADVFRVDPKTVVRWAISGQLPAAFRTPGGHRRWTRAAIMACVNTPADRPKDAK